MCMHCTRRQFLGTGAASGLAMAAGHMVAAEDVAATATPDDKKVRICVIIAGKGTDQSWSLPNEEVTAIQARLAQAEKNLGNVKFVVGRAANAEQAAALLQEAGPEAPVLAICADIFGLTSGFKADDGVMQRVFKQGRPAAVFHVPVIGGHDWCLVKPWQDAGHRVTLVNSSDYDDLEQAAALLRVIPLLRQSRVLVSPPFKGTPESYSPEQVKQKLGVEMLAIAEGRYDEVMSEVDESKAASEAKCWLQQAEDCVEPKREDVLKAARASLTLDRLIAENQAHGLCVGTCMSWLSRGFPCLGFSRLNDRGIPAACDGDMDCLLTMLIFQHALGQPGFLGNAAGVDTSRSAFHLSHCSAPLKMDGPEGPSAKYLLRRHAEVRGGAVPEVHYRIGQKLTFTKLVHLNTLLTFTGTIIDVPRVPAGKERGCRTELVAEVSDGDRLLANWGGGELHESATDYYASLHRVAYYGDHTRSIQHLGRLLGLKVVAEC
jgi:hypothetical protein